MIARSVDKSFHFHERLADTCSALFEVFQAGRVAMDHLRMQQLPQLFTRTALGVRLATEKLDESMETAFPFLGVFVDVSEWDLAERASPVVLCLVVTGPCVAHYERTESASRMLSSPAMLLSSWSSSLGSLFWICEFSTFRR